MSGNRARRDRRTVETSEYVAFMQRVIAGFGARVADDPAALVHLRDLQDALRDAVNEGVFRANRGSDHYSQNEIGAMLNVSRQAIAKRINEGEQVYVARELAREDGALVTLDGVRKRRAELLDRANVADRTGSVKERAAAAG